MIRAAYLAGPIDAVSLEEARDWQDYLADRCKGVLFFSPAHPYRNPTLETADILDEINRAAIDACRCVVAHLPEGRTAFGTIREIEYSVKQDYPTIVVAPGLKSLLRYDFDHYETLDEAAQHLNRMTYPLITVAAFPEMKYCPEPSWCHEGHDWTDNFDKLYHCPGR